MLVISWNRKGKWPKNKVKYKITLDQVKEAYPTIRWGGRGG